MRRIITSTLFLLVIGIVPYAAFANINVSISDGTTTKNAANPLAGFVLSQASPAGSLPTTLFLLSSCTAPCTRFFPSGFTTQQTGDTFRFQDIAATARARIIKTDSTTDRLELRGIKITSLTAGKTLTMTFETQVNDLTTFSSASGSYPFSVALTGSFRTNGGTGSIATACINPTSSTYNPTTQSGATALNTQLQTACVKLQLAVNGISANNVGPIGIATASIACKNGFFDANGNLTKDATEANWSVQCGTGGSYTSTSFNTSDSGSITCPDSDIGLTQIQCKPVQKATLVAKFNGTNETLTSANSGITGLANSSDEDFGFVELATAMADTQGGNKWVAYTAGNELYKATPNPPLSVTGSHVQNQSTIPLSFGLEQGELVPVSEVKLVSLVSNTDIIPTDLARYRRSYASFVPDPSHPLALKDVSLLSFNYTVLQGLADSADPRLDNVNFSDCSAGSIRGEIEIQDPKTKASVGSVHIYLGDAPNGFANGCAAANSALSTTNLVTNADSRVDTSFLIGNIAAPCCDRFSNVKNRLGKYTVRSVSFVTDQGVVVPPATLANYGAEFFGGTVNEFSSASPPSLFTAANYTDTTDLPTDGRSMQIWKLSGVPEPVLVHTVPDSAITNNGGKFTTQVNSTDLQPNVGGTDYRVDMCLFGGRCIPDQGFMSLN